MTANPPRVDTAEHFPHLPSPGMLTAADRICTASLPSKTGRAGIRRVFHEAGPVAFVGEGQPLIRCIHCAREFAE